MRIVTNKELSNYKVLPFDLYVEKKGKILEAGEVLTPGKLMMIKNYLQVYTEDISKKTAKNEEENKNKNKLPVGKLANFSYETLDPMEFDTVINKEACLKMDVQVKVKYFYKRTLDLLKNGYYVEALEKLDILVSVLKTEVFKNVINAGKGSRIRFLGEYEYCHPLNVAVVSGLIAQKLDYSSILVDKVLMAALLHDIGKLNLKMPYTEAILTMNEENVKEHTHLGYKIIKENFGLPEEIALAALEHHENNDGSGYPDGLSNDYISEIAQIINVANYYDNLAFNRTHFLIVNNKEALRAMLESGTKRFSAKMLYTFIHMFNYDDMKEFNDMMI